MPIEVCTARNNGVRRGGTYKFGSDCVLLPAERGRHPLSKCCPVAVVAEQAFDAALV